MYGNVKSHLNMCDSGDTETSFERAVRHGKLREHRRTLIAAVSQNPFGPQAGVSESPTKSTSATSQQLLQALLSLLKSTE